MIIPHSDNIINPLVSIVVCTYNREMYIKQTIDSILSQKRDFTIEIIIGDDASNDRTREILLNYQKENPEIFTLVFHDNNQGAGKNWASLMKLVNGKYVALCDDDDYWHLEDKLRKQIDILEKNENIGLVHTDYRKLDINTNNIIEKKIKNSTKKSVFQSLFDGEYFLLPSSAVFRNSLIRNFINLDDYITYEFPIQDWVTWLQIAKYTEFYHLNISTATYRISEESVTRSNDSVKLLNRYNKEQIMYKYICDKFKDEVIYDDKRWSEYVNHVLLVFSYNTNDFEKAKFYGSKLKNANVRVLCSKNKFLFNLYFKIKVIKSHFLE